MNDDSKDAAQPKETMDELRARYDREANEALGRFMEALTAYTDAIRRKAGFHGWEAGQDFGWKSAHEQLLNELKRQTTIPTEPQSQVLNLRSQSSTAAVTSTLDNVLTSEPPTANELVLAFITDNPGKRGVEIASHFEKTVSPIPERTVRTALHRLKNLTPPKIKIVDGRWYAAEAAPADPQLALKE
jgi:hypothetical protein